MMVCKLLIDHLIHLVLFITEEALSVVETRRDIPEEQSCNGFIHSLAGIQSHLCAYVGCTMV